jgi:hypothetical protein
MSDANIAITSGHGGTFGSGVNVPRAPYLRVHYGDPNASASTFVWSNGATSEDLTNVGYGTYSVTITDCYGCTTTASATVGVSVTYGCTDINACNYDAAANTDDGSCTYPGCTDTLSCDYDATAGCDDGSCTYPCLDNVVAVNMYDSWGDGWNGNMYTITDDLGNVVATNGLIGGWYGTDTLCLPDGCYDITVGGGSFQNEVTFDFGPLVGAGVGSYKLLLEQVNVQFMDVLIQQLQTMILLLILMMVHVRTVP